MVSVENNLYKGRLIYYNLMNVFEVVVDWIMEGLGEVMFSDGWMCMYLFD